MGCSVLGGLKCSYALVLLQLVINRRQLPIQRVRSVNASSLTLGWLGMWHLAVCQETKDSFLYEGTLVQIEESCYNVGPVSPDSLYAKGLITSLWLHWEMV